MCGIAGIVVLDGAPPERGLLEAMCATLTHRGPDDQGLHVSGNVGLGMRRLAIIDVAGGRQPLFNETRTIRTVFNGEIYNFRELRGELVQRGHRFDSATDGEVIVHLWEEHGPAFVERLNGMYAIALHDQERQQFVLARDRLGIKPLYYHLSEGRLVFASEIKAILASGLALRSLDIDALGQLLAWEYIPAPATLLREIRKLDAAELLLLDLRGRRSEIRAYWDVPAPRTPAGDGAPSRIEEWEERIDVKLAECVRRQLVSDVPLGAFLSGGVDSSLVVAAMGPARTFSIGFDDPSYDEVTWSRAVARHLGVDHQVKILEPQALELFDRLMAFMDDPIGDFSIFPTYLISEAAREHVTVALSGDGGDELFGGYETYVAQQKARTWSLLPRVLRERVLAPLVRRLPPQSQKKGLINKARRFVEGLEHAGDLGHARWRLFAGEAARRGLFTPEALRAMNTSTADHVLRLFRRAGERGELDRCLYVDLKSYLSDNCLVKVDRMSMACSLEVRVPFLDHELVELAFEVPAEFKVSRGRTKVLLKRAACRHVPRECVYRPKQGFSIPVKNWLRAELRPLMEELLAPRSLETEGLFQPPAVERLKQEHLQGRENHSHVLWSLMVFQDWRRRWRA